MYNVMVEGGGLTLNMYQNSNTVCSGEGGWDNRGKWKPEQTRQAEVKGKAKNKMAVTLKSIPGYL